jgi:thiamine pyrophosphate-dependent acetolactate synthase large subunit-like protein
MMKLPSETPGLLNRREVVATLLNARNGALVVTGLGSAAYDVHAAGDRDENYYLWGAMGGAAMVGLGLAQAQPARRVLVITGDGEQLMGLGSLATIAVARPGNLDLVVIDNKHYGETGMQTSHTGLGVDLAKIAAACGFAQTGTLTDMDEVRTLAASNVGLNVGPRLFVIEIAADSPPRSLPPRDAVYIKNRLRAHLGFAAT